MFIYHSVVGWRELSLFTSWMGYRPNILDRPKWLNPIGRVSETQLQQWASLSPSVSFFLSRKYFYSMLALSWPSCLDYPGCSSFLLPSSFSHPNFPTTLSVSLSNEFIGNLFSSGLKPDGNYWLVWVCSSLESISRSVQMPRCPARLVSNRSCGASLFSSVVIFSLSAFSLLRCIILGS